MEYLLIRLGLVMDTMHVRREQSGVEVPLEELRGSWPSRRRQDVDGGVGAPRAGESATPEPAKAPLGRRAWAAVGEENVKMDETVDYMDLLRWMLLIELDVVNSLM